jgi:hypothetical protein
MDRLNPSCRKGLKQNKAVQPDLKLISARLTCPPRPTPRRLYKHRRPLGFLIGRSRSRFTSPGKVRPPPSAAAATDLKPSPSYGPNILSLSPCFCAGKGSSSWRRRSRSRGSSLGSTRAMSSPSASSRRARPTARG